MSGSSHHVNINVCETQASHQRVTSYRRPPRMHHIRIQESVAYNVGYVKSLSSDASKKFNLELDNTK